MVAPHIGFENGYFTVALPQFGDKRWTVPASTVLSALKGVGIEATYSAPVPIVQNGKTVGVLGAALQFSTHAARAAQERRIQRADQGLVHHWQVDCQPEGHHRGRSGPRFVDRPGQARSGSVLP